MEHYSDVNNEAAKQQRQAQENLANAEARAALRQDLNKRGFSDDLTNQIILNNPNITTIDQVGNMLNIKFE